MHYIDRHIHSDLNSIQSVPQPPGNLTHDLGIASYRYMLQVWATTGSRFNMTLFYLNMFLTGPLSLNMIDN